MAASIKLCQPSVLWQQSCFFFFLLFHPFFFLPSDTQNVMMNRTWDFFFLSVHARQVLQTKMTMWRNRALRREERSRETPPPGMLWWHGVVVLWNSLHLALCRGSVRNWEWGCFPLLFFFKYSNQMLLRPNTNLTISHLLWVKDNWVLPAVCVSVPASVSVYRACFLSVKAMQTQDAAR